jgi:DNA-binding MarR family transcriptional regulator
MSLPLRKLTDAIAIVRSVDPEMPAQTLQALLLIAAEPGIQQRKLREKLDVASSTAARIVARLGEWERYHVQGAQLVMAERDPQDRRQQLLWLTPKGQKVVKQLEATI